MAENDGFEAVGRLTYPQYLVLLVMWEKDGQPETVPGLFGMLDDIINRIKQ